MPAETDAITEYKHACMKKTKKINIYYCHPQSHLSQ